MTRMTRMFWGAFVAPLVLTLTLGLCWAFSGDSIYGGLFLIAAAGGALGWGWDGPNE